MTSRNFSRHTRIALVVIAGMGLTLGACEKKKKAPPPPPPPPPPAAAIPDPVDINGIMAEAKPDGRVKFPEKNAPADAELATAVIDFASDFAKGDSAALQGKLSPESRAILDTLMADGTWTEETRKIEQVRIVQLSPLQETDVQRATVVMAIQAPGGAYPLAWEAKRNGSGWTFASLTSENLSLTRASDFDNRTVRLGAKLPNPHTAPGADAEGDDEGGNPDQPTTTEPEEKEDGPTKKQTPGGPIEIPKAPSSPGDGRR
jgi:hypothetical protein